MGPLRWQIEPMSSWPYPQSAARRSNPFRTHFEDILTLLLGELAHLKVRGAVAVRVVAASTDVRQDGMLRAHARVGHPGVALSFHCEVAGSLTYPCDRFVSRRAGEPSWQVNLRAIALGLEALRKLDRYGIGARAEQYVGWRSIEAGPGKPAFADAEEALRFLCTLTGLPADTPVGVIVRRASRVAHPDGRAGDRVLWDRVDVARQLLEVSGGVV
jgi:hypothetical protein